MIQRISPPIALISPKGKCWAHFIIDYGLDHDLLFVCFQDNTGECWTWRNQEIRIANNSTIGRNCHIKSAFP